jgi:hypothetical protein
MKASILESNKTAKAGINGHSGRSVRPRRSESPATYDFFNRNYNLLELTVNHRKQTTEVRSNRDRIVA